LSVGHGFGLAAELSLGACSVASALRVGVSTVPPTFGSARATHECRSMTPGP